MEEGKNKSKLTNARNVLELAFDLVVFAEVLVWYLSDGDQTFHGYVQGKFENFRDGITRRTAVHRTLGMIRELPETPN